MLNKSHKGIQTLIAGVFIHLMLGTFYLWGGINLYVTSYLRNFQPNLTLSLTSAVFPFSGICINIGIGIGKRIADRYGYKLTILCCTIGISLANLIASFAKDFIIVAFTNGIIFGLFAGISYMLPVFSGYHFFPKRKGMVSGIIIAGFGFGTFIFTLIAQVLANPNNLKPDIDNNTYFDNIVADNVPKMFRILAGCYLILGTIGGLLIVDPNEHEKYKVESELTDEIIIEDNQNKESFLNECPDIISALKTKELYLMIFMITCSATTGLFIASAYKTYGLQKINDDKFITLIGSIGGAINGGSRIFWSTFMDKFSGKVVYGSLLVLQICLISTINEISTIKALYGIWVCLIFFCEGGHFSIFPTFTVMIYGRKKCVDIYAIVFCGFSLGMIIQFILASEFEQSLGYATIFYIFTGASIAALIVLIIFFKPFIKWNT